MITEKKCSKCKETKPTGEFHRNKSKKDGLPSQCKMCIRQYHQSEKYKQYQREYQQSEKRKQYQREYQQSEKHKQYQREYRRKYQQSEKYKQAQWKYQQSEKSKQSRREYQQSEKRKQAQWKYHQSEKYKQYQREYQQSEKRKQYQRRYGNIRRTNETNAGGSYTPAEWYSLCKFYDFHCLRCDVEFPFDKLTMDHVKPVIKGGPSFIWNAQPLCKSCNSKKNDKEIDYRQTLPDWIDRDGPIWVQDNLF